MKYYYALMLGWLCLAPSTAPAQTPAMNRLRGQLRQATADTARARLWLALSDEYSSPDSSLAAARLALKLISRRWAMQPQISRPTLRSLRAYALNNIGLAYDHLGPIDSAIFYMGRSATDLQLLGDSINAVEVLVDQGKDCVRAQRFDQALAIYRRGLRLITPLPGSAAHLQAYSRLVNALAALYSDQHDYSAARRYLLQLVSRLQSQADSTLLIMPLTTLVVAEKNLPGCLPAATVHARRALRLAEAGTDVTRRQTAQMTLGMALAAQGNLREARTMIQSSLLPAQASTPFGQAYSLLRLAEVEQQLGLLSSALKHAQEVHKLVVQNHLQALRAQNEKCLSTIYHSLGQDDLALAHYRSCIAARDSNSNEQTRQAILTQRLTYESQLKEAQLVTARQRAEAETEHQKLLRWLGLGAGLLLLGLLALLYRLQRERQRVAQALEARRLADLQALDRLKTNFFTNISHEFRTPLTLILGPAETLAAHPADAAVREQGGLVRRNARKLLHLTTQLLDLSKLEAGALRLRPAAADAAQATRLAVGNFTSLAEANGVALTVEGSATALPLVFDSTKLEEMLDNLLANALRLTPTGGRVQVSVTATAPDAQAPLGGVAWTVADTGPGIAPENLPRLFERFYQVPEGGEAHAGTGLGLALVRELAALHGGTATVASAPGRGTTFRIWLPQGLVPMAAEAATALGSPEPHQPTTPPIHQSTTPSLHQSTPDDDAPLVLLVEDNADVRAFVRATLAPAGYRLLEAPGGESGLALARAEVPDLIVSDVMMPGLTGYELCAALKTDVATSHIPVVLLTARASADDKLEGLETGADAYLAKPFNPRELQAQVRNLLALRERVRERFGWVAAVGDELEVSGMTAADAATDRPTAPLVAAASPAPANPLHDAAALAALPPLDRQFLEKVNALLAAHLGDEGFGVDQMSEALALSRTQVHRKLKALTGQTPGECLRLTRLHCALALLQARAGTVADIAFQVGYGSPAHFSTAFSRQFGFLPSAAHRQEPLA